MASSSQVSGGSTSAMDLDAAAQPAQSNSSMLANAAAAAQRSLRAGSQSSIASQSDTKPTLDRVPDDVLLQVSGAADGQARPPMAR